MVGMVRRLFQNVDQVNKKMRIIGEHGDYIKKFRPLIQNTKFNDFT